MDFIANFISNFGFALEYTEQQYPILMFLIYFSFAASVGSFLGCCFYRIPRKISLINPKKSFCPSCNKELKTLDLLPIFSYLFLLGKCRYCKTKISAKYFIIELISVIMILSIIYL